MLYRSTWKTIYRWVERSEFPVVHACTKENRSREDKKENGKRRESLVWRHIKTNVLILIAPSKNSIKWLWSYKKLEYNISGIILVYDGLRQLEKSTASNLKTTGSRFQWAHGMDNLHSFISKFWSNTLSSRKLSCSFQQCSARQHFAFCKSLNYIFNYIWHNFVFSLFLKKQNKTGCHI